MTDIKGNSVRTATTTTVPSATTATINIAIYGGFTMCQHGSKFVICIFSFHVPNNPIL